MELLGYLNDAAGAYHQALGLFPEDAVVSLATVHSQLGIIYGYADDLDTALTHYKKSIYYMKRSENSYGAGHNRFNAAISLALHEQLGDALLYAQAALRDYEHVGAGATADIDRTKQLIAFIERRLSAGGSPSP